MLKNSTWKRILGLGLVAFLLAGCGGAPKMGRYDYRITLDDALRDTNTGMMPSIEVDLVGVNESEKDRWDEQNIDQYFTPRDVVRANADRHSMAFTNSNSAPKLLKADAPDWGAWIANGATHMFIFASIPLETTASGIDRRRLVLPLDRARWQSGVTIEILVKPSGVECKTAQKPAKR